MLVIHLTRVNKKSLKEISLSLSLYNEHKCATHTHTHSRGNEVIMLPRIIILSIWNTLSRSWYCDCESEMIIMMMMATAKTIKKKKKTKDEIPMNNGRGSTRLDAIKSIITDAKCRGSKQFNFIQFFFLTLQRFIN